MLRLLIVAAVATYCNAAASVPKASISSGGTSERSGVPALVIGGNFTLNGKTTNLAQYDTNSHTWYTRFEPQLYLYGEAAGEVNDLVVRPSTLYDSLYVVGSFDTVCKTCQQLYCSVGFWTGEEFDKVGDGLCPRATDVTMKILTAALTPGGGAFFVGGTFQSRVWSGEKFVNIYNVAQHDPTNDAWLPLQGNSSGGGGLGCNWCTVSVLSLAWNDQAKILYIGGKFNMVDSAYIAPGLAVWTKETGIQAFPGGGLSYQTPGGDDSNDTVYDGVATSLVYDEESRSLFVAGTFQLVNGRPCSSIAVWREELRSWRCLYEEQHSFSLITSLLYTKKMLYVAGMPANASSWSTTSTTAINPNPNRQNGPATYMIARMSQSPALFSGKYDQWTGGDLSDNTSDHTSKGGRQLQSHRMLRGSRPVSLSEGSAAQEDPSQSSEISPGTNASAMGTGAAGGGGNSNDTDRFYWEWLPGFGGQTQRINKLAGGTGEFSSSIFIGGEFSPPVLVWTDDPKWGASTRAIGEEGDLVGVVTSITQMQLAPPDTHGQTSKAGDKGSQEPEKDAIKTGSTLGTFTLGVVVVCIILGICLGVAMAFMCHNQQYLNVPWLKNMVEGRNGISLTTLAGSTGLMANMEQEFKERFDRAMQARHLWKGHNLNVVNPKEIVLHKIIGEGSFGRVWSGMWRSSQVAVKEFVFAQAAVTGGSLQRNELIEEIVGEAAVMSFLRHPRILHLYGCSLTSQAIWIVSELCSRGSLRQVLDDRSQHLPLVMRLRIAVDIAEGMLYLHSREQPIIHRDLKSHNVFIQETATGELLPKIGDWGSARAVMLHTGGMRTMTHGVGTACWLAPEVIRHAKGSWQSDVYAFGILLWELATREEVHSNLSAAQIIARVANEGLRPKVPCNCPWREVMVSCWHEEPQARPSFTEVVRRLTALLERRVATQSSSISPLRPQRRGSGSGGAYSSLAQRSGTTSRSSGDRSSGSGTSEALPYRVRTHSLEEHDAGDATGRASGQESPVADLRELAQRAKSRRHRGKRPRYREDKEQS